MKFTKNKHDWKIVVLWGVLFFILISLLLYFRRFDYNLFIANKAIAGAAVILIGTSFLIGPLARFWPKTWTSKLYLRKHFGIFGFGVAILHTLITIIILSPEQYPKLYSVIGTLNPVGQWSLLLGTLALLIFVVISITSIPSIEKSMKSRNWLIIQRIGYIAFLLVFVHIFLLKWKGWINPENWINSLPPGSLIPAVFIVFVFIMRFLVILSPGKYKRVHKD